MPTPLADTIALARDGRLGAGELMERFLDARLFVREPLDATEGGIPVFCSPGAGLHERTGRDVVLAAPKGSGITVDPAGDPFVFAPFIVDAARRGVIEDADL